MTREEAIKAIKAWDFLDNDEKEVLETLIPELKESEDERIRKEIIDFILDSETNESDDINRWLAWLEKQGEKSKWSEEDEAHLHSVITHLGQWIERHPNTCGADIQWENLAWLKQIKQRMGGKE